MINNVVLKIIMVPKIMVGFFFKKKGIMVFVLIYYGCKNYDWLTLTKICYAQFKYGSWYTSLLQYYQGPIVTIKKNQLWFPLESFSGIITMVSFFFYYGSISM